MPATSLVSFARFRKTRLLRSALEIETWLGVDDETGAVVLIKTVRKGLLPAGAEQRLLRDCAALLRGEVRPGESAALVAPLFAGQVDDVLQLVAPFIPGVPLAELLTQTLTPLQTLIIGKGLLEGLRAAHRRDVLHLSLKPSEVIVDRASFSARLTGFCLSRASRLDGPLDDAHRDAVMHLSPEQSGLLGRGVDARSDLYSVGVLLYRCLCGTPPFEAATLHELLQQHLAVRPASLRSRGAKVPRALDELVQRLLRKEPRERYQSAASALADLTSILTQLEGGVDEPAVPLGAHDVRSELTEPALVGRSHQLRLLDGALQATQSGHGSLVLLSAPSGGGKTRLLDELMQLGLARGFLVLRSQAQAGVAPQPFDLFAQLASALADHPEFSAAVAQRLTAQLGADRAQIAAALPQLHLALGQPARPVEVEQAAPRAASALASFLRALGSPAKPALVMLDDVQWAGEQSLAVLEELSRAPAENLLVVAACRADKEDLRPPLFAACIELPPLDAVEIRSLTESMAGPLPAPAIDEIVRLAEGNAFLASALVQGIVETGGLRFDGVAWRVGPDGLRDLRSSDAAASLLARRLTLLPPSAARLLAAFALLGKSFEVDTAAELIGCDPGEARAALEEGRQRHLIWADGQPGRFSFAHERLRAALLARLAPGEQRDLHRRAAERLESRPGDHSFALAYHFNAAGVPERALPHALAAAQTAFDRYAFDLAIDQLHIAEVAAPDVETRVFVRERLSAALILRGRYAEAEVAILGAIEEISSEPKSVRQGPRGPLRLRLRLRLAELAYRRGDLRGAARLYEQQIRTLGRHVPRTVAGFLWRAGVEGVLQALHGLFPRQFVLGARGQPPSPSDAQVLRASVTLIHLYIFTGNAAGALWLLLRLTNLAERYAETHELVLAYSLHAAWAQLGLHRRALSYTARGIEIARRLGDLEGESRSATYHALALCWSGQYPEATQAALVARPLAARLGDEGWQATTHYVHALSLYFAGALREATEIARNVCLEGKARGDALAMGLGLELWAKASFGTVPLELVAEARKQAGREVLAVQATHQAEGVILLRKGRYREAASQFAEAEQCSREARLQHNNLVLGAARWVATALRLQVEALGPLDVNERRKLLRLARAAARRAVRHARFRPSELPPALRELGLVSALLGDAAAARKLLQRALREAERFHAKAEWARTLLSLGRAGVANGWPGAHERVAEGERELHALGVLDLQPAPEPTLALADRFDLLIESGRRIASSLHESAAKSAVQEGGVRLLRADACAVIPVPPDGATARALGVQPSQVLRAVSEGRPLLESSDGLDMLCVPILLRGTAHACLAASAPQGKFGPVEVRLASFLAALAGTALENVAGFEASRRSEREVREMTAAGVRAQEEERRRLALALHDGAGQALSVASMKLQVVARKHPQAAAPLADIEGLVTAALEDLRGLSHDLRPAALDRLGLVVALRELALASTTGDLRVELRASDEVPQLSPDVAVALFRIAQAALGNVLRHSGAHLAQISLTSWPSGVCLEIVDDGRGFDPDARRSSLSGIGLMGMRERATWLSGSFSVESSPGGGTRVRVEVPNRFPEFHTQGSTPKIA